MYKNVTEHFCRKKMSSIGFRYLGCQHQQLSRNVKLIELSSTAPMAQPARLVHGWCVWWKQLLARARERVSVVVVSSRTVHCSVKAIERKELFTSPARVSPRQCVLCVFLAVCVCIYGCVVIELWNQWSACTAADSDISCTLVCCPFFAPPHTHTYTPTQPALY